jgi:hypothetical protein
METVFQPFMTWADELKIPIAVAAGNGREERLHEKLPHKLGTRDNMVITVGGVNKDGTLWENTAREEPGQPGSMSVYAPAVDIVVPTPGNIPDSGTSQATAIVVSTFLVVKIPAVDKLAVWTGRILPRESRSTRAPA